MYLYRAAGTMYLPAREGRIVRVRAPRGSPFADRTEERSFDRLAVMAKRARALQSFEPDPSSIFEIELAEGDEVELVDGDAPSGWQSILIDGIEGLVPSDYLEVIEPEATAAASAEEESSRPDSAAGVDSADDIDWDESALEDANKRQALHDFEVEPGVIYELPLVKGEIVELLDEPAPEGWLTVKKMDADGSIGLVPDIYLGPAPKSNPNAPTEEQLALRKAQEAKAEVDAKLAKVMEEKAAVEEAKEEEADAAAQREENLKKQMDNLENLDLQRVDAGRRRIEASLVRQAELEDRRNRMDEEEAIWPSTDQEMLKSQLDKAEELRKEAEATFSERENEMKAAERKLRDSERAKRDAAQALRKNEEARDANARALRLLPEIKQLLAPTQKELQMCIEAVTTAVLKNAEESARLLAKLALTEAPEVALRAATRRRNEGLKELTLKFGADEEAVDFDLADAGGRTTANVISMAADKGQRADLGQESFRSARGNSFRASSPPRHTNYDDTYKRVPHPPPGKKNWDTVRNEVRRPPLQRAVSFSSRNAALSKRQSMPDQLRSTVSHGAANTRSTVQLRRGSAGGRAQSARRSPGRRGPMPARLRADVGVAGGAPGARVGGHAMGFRPLDDDVPEDGDLHTRDPSFHPPQSPEGEAGAPSSPGGVSAPPPTIPSRPATAGVRSKPAMHAATRSTRRTSQENPDEPVWQNIGGIAPNAEHQFEQIEAKHVELRNELARTRSAITRSKYGQIEHPGPSPNIRVQHRTAHATYSYMMRQRKARDLGMRQQETFRENYDMR